MRDADDPTRQWGVEVAPGVRVAEDALRFTFSAASGPGGQNVNKRATKCTLRIALNDVPLNPGQRSRLEAAGARYLTDAGDLVIQSGEHRSQEQNRGECLARLRTLLVSILRAPKVRRATKPSRAAKERRISEKKSRGEIKRLRRGNADR